MGRKNHRGAKPQVRRNPWSDLPQPARRPIEQMPRVPIAGVCPGPKHRLRYATQQTALKALTVIRKTRLLKGHPESSIEKRAYECPIRGCDGWHLTSRVEWKGEVK